jgi:hypothetical protein
MAVPQAPAPTTQQLIGVKMAKGGKDDTDKENVFSKLKRNTAGKIVEASEDWPQKGTKNHEKRPEFRSLFNPTSATGG